MRRLERAAPPGDESGEAISKTCDDDDAGQVMNLADDTTRVTKPGGGLHICHIAPSGKAGACGADR